MFKRAIHSGVILKEELEELGITLTEFARQIDVPANRISQIISGKRAITGDTALRFGHWFGTDAQFRINLQAPFDLAVADLTTGEYAGPKLRSPLDRIGEWTIKVLNPSSSTKLISV